MKYRLTAHFTGLHYYPFGLTMAGISSKASQFGNPQNKFKYNGKEEQRNEFSVGSGLDWLDFGSRMYDGQIGRWQNVDPRSSLYFRITPFAFALNDPINLIDSDGELVRDKNGNVVFIPIKIVSKTHKGDKTGTAMEEGYVIANDGVTFIKAFRNLSGKKGFNTDCHGQTFTDGKLWIDNEEVRKILLSEKYSTVKKENLKKGDVVIYTDKDGNVKDSRTVSKIGSTIIVYGQGGLESENYEKPIDEAWNQPGTKQEYYRKSIPDPKVDENTINQLKQSVLRSATASTEDSNSGNNSYSKLVIVNISIFNPYSSTRSKKKKSNNMHNPKYF